MGGRHMDRGMSERMWVQGFFILLRGSDRQFQKQTSDEFWENQKYKQKSKENHGGENRNVKDE